MAITLDGTNGVTTPDLTVDTDTLSVDATNNTVGIRNTSSNALQAVNGRPGLVVGDTSGARGIAILTSATGAGSLLFANATSGAGTYRGYIEYDHNGNTLNTYINSSVHAQRIHSDGVISIPQGIELGSGVDKTAANTLDDYEEGTFTPNVYHSGSNNSTFSTKTGEYTKIGNTVTCQVRVDHGNSGTANGDLTLGGLPFAPAQANGTMSIGIWGANPSSQVGNIFGGSTPTLFKGGSNIQTQISFFTATLVYKTS